MSTSPNITVVDHPVVQMRLSRMRDVSTKPAEFRQLLAQITQLMTYEVTRDYAVEPTAVRTPLAECEGVTLSQPITLVPVLRAGLGMTQAVLDLLPDARVGYLGLYRDEETLQPVEYYCKFPPSIAEGNVIVLDPMLATAGSLTAAVDRIKQSFADADADPTGRIHVLCLVSAPEGIEAMRDRHPDVPIYTAAVDDRLNEVGYIVPGLGDAGDRLFGTL